MRFSSRSTASDPSPPQCLHVHRMRFSTVALMTMAWTGGLLSWGEVMGTTDKWEMPACAMAPQALSAPPGWQLSSRPLP